MMGAIYGSLGLIFLPFLLLGGFASLMLGRGSEALSGITLLALAILAPVFYGAMGFVIGALTAWIYNLIAKWLGGIQLELKAEVAGPS
jgi:hypothetical protein